MTSHWFMPETMTREDGETRQVGVEIELKGLELRALADLVANTLGGNVDAESKAECTVTVPGQGDYRVEIDYALLKELAREQEARSGENSDPVADLAVDVLSTTSSMVVPCEIVSPPLPLDGLAAPMDDLVSALRAAGAKGTRQSLVYAFGVHLNVEPSRLDPATVLRYMRAFVCLYDWLVDEGRIDLSRRLTPYIDRFPTDYERLVAEPSYAPDWSTLIDDYLDHNPTRDRALDMLPMFAHIDESRVLSKVEDALIKARPTFHYRLANSCVDEEGWSIAQPWNLWMRIERLVTRPERLDELARRFLENAPRLLPGLDRSWADTVREWLDGEPSPGQSL